MDHLLTIAQAAADAPAAAGVDWTGIAFLITALGGFVATVLGALGYTKQAKQVKDVTAMGTAVVHGVERAQKGDPTELMQQFKAATGVELTPEQVLAAQALYSKHVKKSIKETALGMNVEELLADFVDRQTGKLSKDELAKRLGGDA